MTGSRSVAESRCKLNQRDWESGYVIAFGARDQLVSRIEKIEGNVLTLADAANRTVKDAVVRHNDTFALQAAVDQALKEKRSVHVPRGALPAGAQHPGDERRGHRPSRAPVPWTRCWTSATARAPASPCRAGPR